jgi:histidine triad (HIT) family protein
VSADCLFCKIVKQEIPSKKAYEDELVYAFHDINPGAPVHILVIPKEHIATTNDLTREHDNLVGAIFEAARRIAEELGIDAKGYRLVFNCNAGGGQTVYHLHLHMLAGRSMKWPPG